MKYIKKYEDLKVNPGELIKFSFSLDSDGEIEDIQRYSHHNEEICKTIINYLLDNEKIKLGEKTEGDIEVDNDNIYLDYKYCTGVGEDWNDDEWENVEENVYDDKIQILLATNKYNL